MPRLQLTHAVNEILSDHNVHKQMTDSKGDEAYLMADISNVDQAEIKTLWQDLEDMPCKCRIQCENVLMPCSSNQDADIILVEVLGMEWNHDKGDGRGQERW